MASPACVQNSQGRYLWCSLLSLGFRPDPETANVKYAKYLNLGVHMFDKPNKDAFYIVTHFLLDKLDPTRFSAAYRYCWPVLDRKADTEFRKITLAWFKDIVDENSIPAPRAMASQLLSPGGPVFVTLMLHLAKHVMLQEMKTFTTDGRWVPEEAAMPASTVDVAMKRLKLTKARFLKSALAQDRLLQEDRRRAQTLGQSIQEIRAEGAKYDTLLKRQENETDTEGEALDHKLLKVRSLWSAIDDMLKALREEKRWVAAVLKPNTDHQYVLDGATLSLKIPRVLLEKIEQLPQQLSSGNMYEGGQLNPLCTLELLNHALLLLREERGRVAGHAPLAQIRLRELQSKRGQVAHLLEELKGLRLQISKEELPEVWNAVRRWELDWERQWRDALQDKPLASFLSDDPALCFLSPMAPLSFEPAAVSSSMFSCYAAKLPGGEPTYEEEPSLSDSPGEFDVSTPELRRQTISKEEIPEIWIPSRSRSPVSPPPPGRAESPGAVAPSYCGNSLFADLLHTLSSPPKGPSPSPRRQARQAGDMNTHARCKVEEAVVLDLECDNLASQFAEAVAMPSPTDDKRRGVALGDLLGKLGADPFSTRKQLHRTPESLISDVRSSWRKAVEECKIQTGTNQSPAATGDIVTTQETPWNQSYGTPRGPLTAAAACPAPSLTPQQHLWNALGSVPAWGSPDTELIPHMEGLRDMASFVDTEGFPDTASPPDAEGRRGVSRTGGGSAVYSGSTLQPLSTSLGSPPAWGFPDTGGRHSVSGTGSSAVHFSLDDETLPDTTGSDSLLSLSDDSRDGDLFLLSPPGTVRPTPLLDLSNSEPSFLGTGTPRSPSTRLAVPGSATGGWLEACATAGASPLSDTVFLLDLEALDSLTPPRREYSLPQLVTFSPMDDL